MMKTECLMFLITQSVYLFISEKNCVHFKFCTTFNSVERDNICCQVQCYNKIVNIVPDNLEGQ